MTRRFLSATCLSFATLLCATVPAPGADSLLQAVGALQHIQAAVARGDQNARSSQPALMKKIGEMIGAFDPQADHDKREFGSVAIYLLSGGDPKRVTPLFKNADVKERAPFLFGALAYATGHQREALKNLDLSETMAISPTLGAHAAYALSVLKTDENREEAISLLDTARLTAPGTLVEEVALRREILLVVQRGDLANAARLMRNYYLRFAKSPYATEFTRSLSASYVLRARESGDEAVRTAIAGSVNMAADARTAFMLTISREMLLDGDYRTAYSAADAALTIAPQNSDGSKRARLYFLISGLLTGTASSSADLEQMDAAGLQSPDRDLLAAAKGIAAQIKAPVAAGGPAGSTDKQSKSNPTIESGEQALAAASSILASQ